MTRENTLKILLANQVLDAYFKGKTDQLFNREVKHAVERYLDYNQSLEVEEND